MLGFWMQVRGFGLLSHVRFRESREMKNTSRTLECGGSSLGNLQAQTICERHPQDIGMWRVCRHGGLKGSGEGGGLFFRLSMEIVGRGRVFRPLL